ncbi:hypothetical protein SNOG_05608 [Parastagonospora nodorum SN15]|uniref:Uncharacterized protein n=1 Tax=Phaeosphaeria nodorum (strain SN15 / ATCC MYA-4574 / FGSC 10173) TaxID=321614 RepID=Q0URK6_PHANO|nr:hypothetical protein SNOG_05608 [Parastagonospora nodorum SN15]EAT86672.1 hypothetical protein SNOG_05608 [Parastagonospora nodorum SN15]
MPHILDTRSYKLCYNNMLFKSPYVIGGPTVAFVAARTSSHDTAAGASTSSQSRNSLSGGTIAGIVVGSIAALVVILSSIFLRWCRKRNQASDLALQDQLPKFIPGTYYEKKAALDAPERDQGDIGEPTELPAAFSMSHSVEAVELRDKILKVLCSINVGNERQANEFDVS